MLRAQHEYTLPVLGLKGPLRQGIAKKFTQVISLNDLLVGSGSEFDALCHFDVAGRLVQYQSVIQKGQYQLNYDYRYDEKGHRVESSLRLPDGILVERHLNACDGQGNPVKTIVFNSHGAQTGYCDRVFDARGNKVQEHHVTINGETDNKTDHTYNDKDQEVSTLVMGKGEGSTIEVRISRQFNEHGLISYEESEQVKYQDGEVVFRYAAKVNYEYLGFDHHHNWVRRLAYRKGVPKELVERELAYYQ